MPAAVPWLVTMPPDGCWTEVIERSNFEGARLVVARQLYLISEQAKTGTTTTIAWVQIFTRNPLYGKKRRIFDCSALVELQDLVVGTACETRWLQQGEKKIWRFNGQEYWLKMLYYKVNAIIKWFCFTCKSHRPYRFSAVVVFIIG